jgi:O-antigen/teichoic acid export membrane protein
MLRTIFMLAGSSMFGLVITVLAFPVLTRLYAPEDFGLLAAILSVSSIIAMIIPGRFPLAIPLAKSAEDARDLFYLASLMCLVLSPLLAVVAILIADVSVDGVPVSVVALSVAWMAYLSSQAEVLSYWRSSRKRFSFGAQISVIQAAVAVTTQMIFSALSRAGMLFGSAFGGSVVLFLSVRDILRHDREILRNRPSWKRLWAVAKEYRDYPLVSMPQGLASAASQNGVPIILAIMVGAAVAGQYWLVYRVLAAPIHVLGNAYRQVMLSQLGDAGHDHTNNLHMVRLHTLVMAAVCVVPIVLGVAYGRALFELVFGPQWSLAGTFAGWLVLGFSIDLIKVPVNCLLQFEGRHGRIFAYDAFAGVLRLSTLAAVLMLVGEIEAIKAFSIVSFLTWALFVGWVLK